MSTVQERVQKGIDRLDAFFGDEDWRSRINVKELDDYAEPWGTLEKAWIAALTN